MTTPIGRRPGEGISARVQAMVYAVAFFTGNTLQMVAVVMPLWALALGASPLVIGLIVSSRQVLVVLFSIHGGALLDRFGPRLVILVLGGAGAIAMALFPALPFIWAAIVLQMLSGFAESTSWIGAQTLVGGLLKGLPVYAGRMTAAARVGGFFGPWTTGLAWQHLGPAWALWLVAAWMLAGGITAWFLPKAPSDAPATKSGQGTVPEPAPAAARNVMPKASDYATTFRMLLLPAVALVITTTFMRQAGSGIQTSFYGVWLDQHGYSAGTIGLLIGIANAASALAALSVGPLGRAIPKHLLLIGVTIIAVAAIAITPLLGGFVALAVAIAFRGAGQGLNFPLMLSLASRAVGPDLQGRVIALRITFNRLGGALVPFIMGAVAQVVGLADAFFVIGAAGVVLLLGLGAWAARSPEIAAANKAG